MKIVCPACDAAYEVPDKVVLSKRKMRCARCSVDWVPAENLTDDASAARPAVPAPEPVAPASPPPVQPPAPPAPVQPGLAAAPSPPGAAWPVLVTPAPDAAAHRPAAEESGKDDDHELARDEPYQLALRPETHLSVFGDRFDAQPVAAAYDLVVNPAPKPPVVAWTLSVLVLAAAVAALLVFRTPIMTAWPPSIRLYGALGLLKS